MSLQFEDEIMQAIGLGREISYYSGSGDCANIRTQAAKKLETEIRKRAGAEIVAPDKALIDLIKLIADRGESSRYTLANTWRACSQAIRAHMRR